MLWTHDVISPHKKNVASDELKFSFVGQLFEMMGDKPGTPKLRSRSSFWKLVLCARTGDNNSMLKVHSMSSSSAHVGGLVMFFNKEVRLHYHSAKIYGINVLKVKIPPPLREPISTLG